MRVWGIFIALLLIASSIGGCDRLIGWAKVMESELGGGYFFVSEGGEQTFVIKSTTEDYEGMGVVVIPPEVLKINDDNTHIIAITAHCATAQEFFEREVASLTSEDECYWVIQKDGDETYGPLTEPEYDEARAELTVSDKLTL